MLHRDEHQMVYQLCGNKNWQRPIQTSQFTEQTTPGVHYINCVIKDSTNLLNYLASHLDFFLSRKIYLYFITPPSTCSYDTITFLSYRLVDIITYIVLEADIFTHARNPRSNSVENANAHRVESSEWSLQAEHPSQVESRHMHHIYTRMAKHSYESRSTSDDYILTYTSHISYPYTLPPNHFASSLEMIHE
jgi:hypothetical protein